MSINPPQEEESRRQSNDSWEEKTEFHDSWDDFHLTWDEINTDDISLGFKRRSSREEVEGEEKLDFHQNTFRFLI